MATSASSMPYHRSFAANVAFNLVGTVAPAVAAAVALPSLVAAIGVDRLGVLTIAWAVVGAFGLLDLGIGRSLTHETAVLLAKNDFDSIRRMTSSALSLLAGSGAVLGLALALGARWLAGLLDVPPGLDAEVRASIVATALAVPFVTTSSALRGVLEAFGRFDWSSAVRVWIGLSTYVGPLIAITAFDSLPAAIASIALARLVAAAVMVVMVTALIGGAPSLRGIHDLGDLAARGAWMTLSSVVGAVLAVADRLVLGAMVSMAAVAYYATPQELVARLTVLPMAVSGILFPAFSAASVRAGSDTRALFARGLWLTFLLLCPLAGAVAALAPEWLGAWLGPEFAAASPRVVQWSCLAVLLQNLAVTPLSLLQTTGQSRLAGTIHVVELPLSIAGLWIGAAAAGIEGVALALAARAAVDLGILMIAARRTNPDVASEVRQWWLPFSATAVWFGAITAVADPFGRTAALAVGLVLCIVLLGRVISVDDMARGRQLFGRVVRSARWTQDS